MAERQQGMTLIEVMMVVAILAIVAGIAYPSYQQYVARTYRAEAKSELSRIANLQEQHYLDFQIYSADMKALGLSTEPYQSESGRYVLDAEVTASGYTIEANATAKQASMDEACAKMTLNHRGEKVPAACW